MAFQLASHRNILILVTIMTLVYINCSPLDIRNKRESLTDRLLSLWTMGAAKDVNGSRENGKSSADSLKNVLEFLTSKATSSNSRLLSQNAKTPKPIDLHNQSPMEAVLKYFEDTGITSKACKLNTICELLTEPQASYGVFGELLSYVFGKEVPDATDLGPLDVTSYKEFYKAAQDGRHMQDCSALYKNCSSSTKEYVKLSNL